jgi:hypothetical protein
MLSSKDLPDASPRGHVTGVTLRLDRMVDRLAETVDGARTA